MESWLTILLGLALLLFQGYSEKKKKEAAKAKRNITSSESFSNEPFFFTSEPEPELETEPDPVKEIHEDILDAPQNAYFKPVDIVETEQDSISSGEIKDAVETKDKPFIEDPRQLVIFSEIMKPKYLEQ